MKGKPDWEKISAKDTSATAQSLQLCPTLHDPIDGSPPGSPSLRFSRQEHWSGLGLIPRVHFSVQFSCSAVSDSLWPHGLQHARLPCPSPTPGASSNSCPLSRWCHPTISSSAVPFSCHQSFPGSRSFLMSQPFASGGQSIGASALASVLPMNIQDWFLLGLIGLVSLQFKGLLRLFSNTNSIIRKNPIF